MCNNNEMYNKFDFNKFVNNLKSIKTITKITQDHTSNCITVKYNDGLQIYVVMRVDSYHKFYTIIDNEYFGKYCYVGEMPHDNYKDLYEEIYRMSSPESRNKQCKSNYFKSY
jgi:hypothetical protein